MSLARSRRRTSVRKPHRVTRLQPRFRERVLERPARISPSPTHRKCKGGHRGGKPRKASTKVRSPSGLRACRRRDQEAASATMPNSSRTDRRAACRSNGAGCLDQRLRGQSARHGNARPCHPGGRNDVSSSAALCRELANQIWPALVALARSAGRTEAGGPWSVSGTSANLTSVGMAASARPRSIPCPRDGQGIAMKIGMGLWRTPEGLGRIVSAAG